MTDIALMHGTDWQGQDVTGWIATEKLDGCRASWDGAALWSRGGHAIKAPPALLADLPPGVPLDGELYAGPGTRGAVAAAMRNGNWRVPVRFVAFDAPTAPGDIAQRLQAAGRHAIAARRIAGIDDALAQMRAVQVAGGEGIMLHQPGQAWRPGRVSHLLKLKYTP